jgi:hypothetical protein
MDGPTINIGDVIRVVGMPPNYRFFSNGDTGIVVNCGHDSYTINLNNCGNDKVYKDGVWAVNKANVVKVENPNKHLDTISRLAKIEETLNFLLSLHEKDNS